MGVDRWDLFPWSQYSLVETEFESAEGDIWVVGTCFRDLSIALYRWNSSRLKE